MSRPLTEAEFCARQGEATELVQQIVDWLWYELDQRVGQRSYGEIAVNFYWEDGKLSGARITGGHVLKPGKVGTLPGDGEIHPKKPARA